MRKTSRKHLFGVDGVNLVLLHGLNDAIKTINPVSCKAALYMKHISQAFSQLPPTSGSKLLLYMRIEALLPELIAQ